MDSKQQLIHSLTSHISLYNSSTPSSSTPNPNPRLSILKWFSSLSLHQRQAHLTISDSNFALILLQMRAKIRSNGHGFFIVLPDIPSRDRPSIPSLCFKRSHGLLSRVSESNELHRLIHESVLMFNSREGEAVDECSSNRLDSVTVRESLVENVDKFVEAMDSVSDGGFLRGEESVLSSDWVELNWLKAKGYYSLEAFVANKLEVALRLSWLNCNNVKKKGAKLKEKVSLAGVAANVYWRKKGCVDWWKNLDYGIKQKLFRTFLGKAAKSLIAEILNGSDNTFKDIIWLSTQVADPTVKKDTKFSRKPSSVSRMPSTLVYVLKGLYVLQDISILLLSFQNREEYCREKLFYSSLGSVSTVSDCILRKLRGMLMVVSLDFTKMELFKEENFNYHPTKKSKEKVCSSARRKKGKTRNSKNIVASDSRSSKDEVILDKPNKEHNKELVSINTQSSSGKSKKKRNKLDNSRSNSKLEAGITPESKVLTSSTSVFQSRNSENMAKDSSICQEKFVLNSNSVSTTNKISAEENVGICEVNDRNDANPSEMDTKLVVPEEKPPIIQDPVSNAVTSTSHEWPSVSASVHRPVANIHHPSTTDRLHLDAGHHNSRLIVHHPVRNPNLENGILSRQPLPMMSLDWPPMVHSVITCNYAFHPQTSDDERVYPRDCEISQDLPDDEEDYSQFFGGGVMYWNPSDRPGSTFSRPPSMSSDDSSSWAWREADMNRTVDDMVTLTSPSSASFCSPFTEKEKNLPETQGTEVKSGDSLPYKILRPIIIPRERSRSEFKRSHDRNSPCVPSPPRIRRPPSPVVLSVPHASPACDSRKHRGFPTVRSGSSSPRHWGVRGWFHDGINFEESCVRMDGCEVVWPSWTNKAHQLTHPLPGALLQDRLIAISQLALDHEHPDVAFPLQPPELINCSSRKASLPLMHSLLHEEIDFFCKQIAAENMVRKPYINWALKRVTRSLQVLWPRSRTNIFGSNATGLNLPTSDVDLVVCLPPVRNLEPIKEAGILEGRNGIKETCLQHAARYLANQEWVKNDSLKIVENTAIPIIMLVVEVPCDAIVTPILNEGKTVHSVRLDISFKSPSHTGLQTTELVKELTEQFPAATPLALVLKQFLADRSLDQSYSGGLSSYCLILLITRFLQHEHHHGRTINQNFGGLLMDFLYFYGNVFDPRRMRVSVHGTGVYVNRERGYSIDPICIDDPLFPANNVGRNCFRIHQCIKAFADAYTILENELSFLPNNNGVESSSRPPHKLLPKIVSSISGIL